MTKQLFKLLSIIAIVILFGYKSLYGSMSIHKINSYLHSNVHVIYLPKSVVIRENINHTFSSNGHQDLNITLEPTNEPSQAPHESYPCDEEDKASKRAIRDYNETKDNIGNCQHPGYHTRHYDDLVNTFTAAVNILYTINVTFVVVQGTLLSLLRHQPILPWDTDADIYLVLDDSHLDEIINSNNTKKSALTDQNDESEMTTSPFNDDGSYNFDYFDYHDYDGGGFWFHDGYDSLAEKVKAATEKYKSNSKDGQEYYAKFDVNDAPNVIRFMKKEATNWGCTGYTDIYIITIDEWSHSYDGGDAGRVAHQPVDLDYLFPIKQYDIGDWRPHWKEGLNISMSSNYTVWNGETLNRNTLPIPNQPHNLSELAYPNHMIPDNNGSVLTCEIHKQQDNRKIKRRSKPKPKHVNVSKQSARINRINKLNNNN